MRCLSLPAQLLLPCACLLFACTEPSADDGADEIGSETDADSTTGTSEDGSTDSEDGSTSMGETETAGETSTDSTADTSSETGEPPPPPSACEEVELPPRDGADVMVAPGPEGKVIVDGSETTLRSVVSSANEGDTIWLEDGVYTFDEAGEGQYTGVYVTTPNITIRSVSGDPAAVILDSNYRSHGGQSAVLTIDAPGVAVAGIGLRRSIFHLVHLWANADDVLLHELELVDGGQQFLKSSGGDAIDNVEVSCSRFWMSPEGRDNVWGYGSQNGNTTCYTGGIDTHEATNWNVHDSTFEGIYCDADGVERPAHGKFPELRDNMTYTGGLAEHAIHMWDSAPGTGHTLTRNHILDCARGIGLGLVAEVHGGVITNNMIFSSFPGGGEHDVGIIVERSIDTLVAHNSVYFSHPEAYSSGIEYRWGVTANLRVHGNLTNKMIRARDGATADLSDNVADDAPGSWFVDAGAGDLHGAACADLPAAALHAEVGLDFDAQTRTDPTFAGADHCE
ncbi:hypothetical protein PPSIR1_33224 [Plesiocystis pacifica SIR-1]|uniref:Right handed beta helix domain-containing protein n=1 Tax=Plesiocystis pacifica SIR-1 TaxID=391625 RepID=A6G6K1_9BACT|nr:hypothetical protein [Plesiocystis pacifica]EDM78478.1 hypothetical protein PPSIR1_33224 [Plesiocystis pacifica SIR-1]